MHGRDRSELTFMSRAERRERARLRNPGLITFREARFGVLQIQIA
jgi:hypothetical protein